MQEDSAFTRQGSHFPGMGGPKNTFPTPLFCFWKFLVAPMVPFFILCDTVYWEIKEEYYNSAYNVVLLHKLITVFYPGYYIG